MRNTILELEEILGKIDILLNKYPTFMGRVRNYEDFDDFLKDRKEDFNTLSSEALKFLKKFESMCPNEIKKLVPLTRKRIKKILNTNEFEKYIEKKSNSVQKVFKDLDSESSEETRKILLRSYVSDIAEYMIQLKILVSYNLMTLYSNISGYTLGAHTYSEIAIKKSPLIINVVENFGKNIGIGYNWVVSVIHLSLFDIIVNRKCKEIGIKINSGGVEDQFKMKVNELVKRMKEKRIEIGELEKEISKSFWNIRNEVIHAGYEPTPLETNLIIQVTSNLIRKILKLK